MDSITFLEKLKNLKIIKILKAIIDTIRWFRDIGFRRKAISCWMKTWENRLNLVIIKKQPLTDNSPANQINPLLYGYIAIPSL
jgi:hypothetical protein